MTHKNMSMADIEKSTGLNKNTLNSILSGMSKNPTANTLKSIAKALDVSLEDILSDKKLDFETLTKDQMRIFSEVTKETIDTIIEKDISFTLDKICALIKEIYQYSMKSNPPTVDKRFIDWILEKHY